MIDVKLRLFIPSRAVMVPVPVIGDVGFDGDDRTFGYEGGTSRAELWIDADNSPFTQSPVTIKARGFGESKMYGKDKLESVAGRPFWWMNVKRDPFLHIEAPPDRVVTAPLTDQSLRVSGRLEPSSIPIIPNLRLSFHVDAANPLEPLAPPINCDLDVLLTATGTQLFSFSVSGSHDAFPAYELYIEQRLVYSYDPVAAGTDPSALFPFQMVTVNVPPSALI